MFLVGSLVVRASDSRPGGQGSMPNATKYPPEYTRIPCLKYGGGHRCVAIYRKEPISQALALLLCPSRREGHNNLFLVSAFFRLPATSQVMSGTTWIPVDLTDCCF
ncbi:hypothetical protein TNCV_172511 [Trichonephila clavipes]|nr:hypothetical protein TNCV_172511 [Trichonephila clavipes]